MSEDRQKQFIQHKYCKINIFGKFVIFLVSFCLVHPFSFAGLILRLNTKVSSYLFSV